MLAFIFTHLSLSIRLICYVNQNSDYKSLPNDRERPLLPSVFAPVQITAKLEIIKMIYYAYIKGLYFHKTYICLKMNLMGMLSTTLNDV